MALLLRWAEPCRPAGQGERGFHRSLRVPEPQRPGTATSRSASRRGDRPPAPWSSLSFASSLRVGGSALLVPPPCWPAGRDRLRNRKLPAAAAASTASAAQ